MLDQLVCDFRQAVAHGEKAVRLKTLYGETYILTCLEDSEAALAEPLLQRTSLLRQNLGRRLLFNDGAEWAHQRRLTSAYYNRGLDELFLRKTREILAERVLRWDEAARRTRCTSGSRIASNPLASCATNIRPLPTWLSAGAGKVASAGARR